MRKFFLVLLLIIPVLGLSFYQMLKEEREQQAFLQSLKDQLQSEVKDELNIELSARMQEQISREVRKELSGYLARQQSPDMDNAPPQDLSLLDTPLNISTDDAGSIQDAVRRVIRETVKEYKEQLTDQQLDSYVAAGSTEPEVLLPGGMTKKPLGAEYALAAAKSGDPATTAKKADSSAKDAEPPAGESKDRVESIERTLVQKGSILLPKGSLQIEPSIAYAHFSSNRLNINGFTIFDVVTIGEISTEKIKRDVFIQTLSLKYGLLNNLQTEIRVPSRWEYDRITDTNGTSESTRNAGGLGDIQASVSRQIGWEHGLMPDLVASLSVKSNSGKDSYNNVIGLGTGHWAVSSALIAAKSSDPAVIFGSLSYTYNLPDDFENYGRVIPGQTLGYSLGTAIALSYQTAINFSFDQSVTSKMQQGGKTVVGSFVNSANFKTGFNWALNERSSVDFSLSLGLTTDAPDFTTEIRIPYSF